MTLSFEVNGNHMDTGRIVTPYHSMNVALSGSKADYGFPTRTLIEINSPDAGIGKSTLATNLASIVSQHYNHLAIDYLDLEGQDGQVILNTLNNSGFRGNLNWVTGKNNKKEENTDEKLLGRLEDGIWDEHVGILDSVAAISPVSEAEGDIGDANMGRRSFSMAQFTRRVTRALRTVETPTALFMLNHQYEDMSKTIGFGKSYVAPGGNVKKFLEKLTIQVRVAYPDFISGGDGKKEGRWKEEGAWILEGNVKKNRSGLRDAKFYVFIYGGWGVHVGMSALIDCLSLGKAEVKTGAKVWMNGTDFGSLNKIVATKRDDAEFFVPFQNELQIESPEE